MHLDDPHDMGEVAMKGFDKVVSNMADDGSIPYGKRMLFCANYMSIEK